MSNLKESIILCFVFLSSTYVIEGSNVPQNLKLIEHWAKAENIKGIVIVTEHSDEEEMARSTTNLSIPHSVIQIKDFDVQLFSKQSHICFYVNAVLPQKIIANAAGKFNFKFEDLIQYLQALFSLRSELI